MIDLSILIPGVESRRRTTAWRLLDELYRQVGPEEKDRVEILYLCDNKERTIGAKRNDMLGLAQGRYVVFVDDDDMVSGNYIEQLLHAIDSGDPDVIVFTVMVSLDGSISRPCYYSIAYPKDYNAPSHYERLPNHIMCVKHDHAIAAGFPEKQRGEDADYAKRLKPFLESEYSIGYPLYYYQFDSQNTETQR